LPQELEPAETYEFDTDRVVYDDVVIVDFVDEEVDQKLVDGFAILYPCADVRDIPAMKARILGTNEVELTLVATRYGFLEHKDAWMKTLETQKKALHATKLFKTLKVLITRLKRTKQKNLKKIIVKFPEEITNEYFSPGAPEGVLTMMPLPYKFSHSTTSKKTSKTTAFNSTEVVLLWRVYIDDSARAGEEEQEVYSDQMEAIADMLGNL
jgi:hypothetical protein